MKRALVFLVLAPASVFFAVLSIGVAIAGTRSLDFAYAGAVALSILTLPMLAVAAAVDGFLARSCPIFSRVCLAAIVGATIATGETAVFSSLLPPSIVMALAIGGAAVTGACSLLSHGYGGLPGPSIVPASPGESGWSGPAGIRHSLS